MPIVSAARRSLANRLMAAHPNHRLSLLPYILPIKGSQLSPLSTDIFPLHTPPQGCHPHARIHPIHASRLPHTRRRSAHTPIASKHKKQRRCRSSRHQLRQHRRRVFHLFRRARPHRLRRAEHLQRRLRPARAHRPGEPNICAGCFLIINDMAAHAYGEILYI